MASWWLCLDTSEDLCTDCQPTVAFTAPALAWAPVDTDALWPGPDDDVYCAACDRLIIEGSDPGGHS